MITSRQTFELLVAATFLVSGLFFAATEGAAADRPHAQAYDDSTAESIEEGPGPLQPTSLVNQYESGCGLVCDCGHCEVACGVETVNSDYGWELGCGIGAAVKKVRRRRWWGNWIDDGCDGSCDGGCDSCFEMDPAMQGHLIDDSLHALPISGSCDCDACVSDSADHIPLCIPILRMDWAAFDFFYGHQGFTGPLNFASSDATNPNARSGNGSFGFYQGFNKGSSLKKWLGCDISSQFGVRTSQSNLWGATFTTERRYQVFVTGGFFRRVDYGLQYGLVLDYLNQDWYFQSDAMQLRGELSWRCDSCDTFGFQFMAGVRSETSDTVVHDIQGAPINSTVGMEPTDQYRFFYRCPILRSGEFTGFGGWTDHSDVVLGTKFNLHLFPRLLLGTDLTYLIPTEGRLSGGNEHESWNVAMGLVFRPGGNRNRGSRRYQLPMFDVANNGTFMMDRL